MKRKHGLARATTWMTRGRVALGELSPTRQEKCVWSHLDPEWSVHGTESQMGSGGDNGASVFSGDQGSLWKDGQVLYTVTVMAAQH